MKFSTPDEAESAFYQALETSDLKLMMSVWAKSEDIVCIHPMAARLSGPLAVESAWRHMFQHPLELKCKVTDQETISGEGYTINVVHENFEIDDHEEAPQPLIATNIYRQEANSWHMVLHHASPIANTTPDEDSSSQLH